MFRDNIQVQKENYVSVNHDFVIKQIDKTLEQLEKAFGKLKRLENIENIKKLGKFGK